MNPNTYIVKEVLFKRESLSVDPLKHKFMCILSIREVIILFSNSVHLALPSIMN